MKFTDILKGRSPSPLGTKRNGFIKTEKGWEWIGKDQSNNQPLTLKEVTESLTRMGVESYGSRIDSKTHIYETYFKDFDLKTYFSSMKKMYKEHGIKFRGQGESMNVTFNEKYIYLHSKGETESGEEFSCKRYLFVDDNEKKVAEHNELVIPPSLRGKDIARQILKRDYQQYIKCGVNQITLQAGMVYETPINGANTWGRYGFGIKNKYECDLFLRELERYIGFVYSAGYLGPHLFSQEDYNEIKGLIDKHYQVYKENKPFPMITVHEKLGKKKATACLQSVSWSGVLDLTDKDSREVFEMQLNKRV